MALLSGKNRTLVTQVFADDESSKQEKVVPGKQDVRAAVNAIDKWVQDNVASFNAAVPEPARSGLTSKQKAKLLMLVVNKRWEVN